VHVGKPRSAIQGRGRVVVVKYTEVRLKKVKKRGKSPEEGNSGSK
jgi:hypothetical protein